MPKMDEMDRVAYQALGALIALVDCGVITPAYPTALEIAARGKALRDQANAEILDS